MADILLIGNNIVRKVHFIGCYMSHLPTGNIHTTVDFGKVIRAKRKKDGLTQAEVAAICGFGNRFLVDLENGKPTVQMGKALEVLKSLGLEIRLVPRGWPDKVET